MQDIFPIAFITSISRAALVATFTSHKVTASIDSASELPPQAYLANHGAECSIVNAFRLQETHADTGILDCGYAEACIQDDSSSTGGRCIRAKDDELALESHRYLLACSFANGTAGQKCVGDYSCYGVADLRKIGCGSCIGNSACSKVGGYVGENSCNGKGACYNVITNVAKTSCNGYYACSSAEANVGLNSCNGDFTCSLMYGSVGHNSCNADYACFSARAYIGDCLCNGPGDCDFCLRPYMNYNNCGEDSSEGTCPSLTQLPPKKPSMSPTSMSPTTSPSKRSSKNNKSAKNK